MKTIFTFLACILAFTALSQTSPKSGIINDWYSQAKQLETSASTISSGFLFPDTNIFIEGTNNAGNPVIHAIAVELDPTSLIYSGLNNNSLIPMGYFLDTLRIEGIYKRHLNASIVDTLLIQIQENPSNAAQYSATNSPWVFNHYMAQNISYHPIYHQANSVYSTDTNAYTIKIPLTNYDVTTTQSSFFDITFPCGYPINVGKNIQAIVSFIPGYSYSSNDSLTNKNYFQFLSMEENGDNLGAGSFPYYYSGDYGMSYTLSSNSLYSTNQPNEFCTSFNYAQAYQFEHHLVSFSLSAGHVDYGPLPDTVYIPYSGGVRHIGGVGFIDSIVVSNPSWLHLAHICDIKEITIDTNHSAQPRVNKISFLSNSSFQVYDEIIYIQEGSVGIADTELEFEYKLYPNPTTTNIYIDLNVQQQGKLEIQIFDILGNPVYESHPELVIGNNHVNINTESFTSGVYFFRLKIGDIEKVGRLIKQ
jgi:hypothetical protein